MLSIHPNLCAKSDAGDTLQDDPGGVAADSGLSTGDVILDVGGSAVKTPVDFYKALTEVQGKGKRIALARVKSGETTRFVAIPVG